MSKPVVVYWNNQPTPYVVARFNAVAEKGKIDLRAWFDTEREPDRSWELDPSQWKFDATYLPKARIGPLVVPFPDSEMLKLRPDVLITPMDRIPGVIAALVGKATSRRVASRTLPILETWVTRTRRAEAAKHFLYRAIDGAKVSGPDAIRMARHYGMPSQRTWTVTQSIDIDLYHQALNVDSTVRDQRRRDLGLCGCTFIYVGRLWKGKGVKYLIDAFRMLHERNNDTSLLILGEGPDEDEMRERVRGVSNVHFIGFVQPLDLPAWYALADVFVFPTLGDPNGLVVEEAMAAGLPVISTTNAGDIRSRVHDGRSGFVVPAFDSHALAEKMQLLAGDKSLRNQMGQVATDDAERYSVDRYADDFERFIESLLAAPSRTTASALVSRVLGRALLRLITPLGYL